MTQTTEPPTRDEWRLALVLSLLILLVTSLPYVLAYAAPTEYVFGGVLINPADGNSYFAKMREGWRGEWLFTLPYTAEPGAGTFIFTYYLLLGHLARWTGSRLDLVYHTARVLGGLALLLTAYAFIAYFVAAARARLAVWALYALGSGLGWLLLPLGRYTSDLKVPEAIPFLSVFANPHFPLATALLLWLILWTAPGLDAADTRPRRLVLIALATTALAQVLPIALLNIGLLLAGLFVSRQFGGRSRKKQEAWLRDWLPAAVFGAAALPWLIYDAALTMTHPVLAQWNAQNLTPSPPLWDALVSGGVLLLLALPGLSVVLRRRSPRDVALLVWLVLGTLALYAPFALQRRLALGLWMPLTLLAGIGLQTVVWPRVRPRLRPLLVGGLVLAAGLSNVIVVASTLRAVRMREDAIFLTASQAASLDWLAANAGRALVAAPPEMGQWVPARTDARVLYGHPFETVGAVDRRAELEGFYRGLVPGRQFVDEHGIKYVLVASSGQGIMPVPADWRWEVVYNEGRAIIYAP